MQEYRRSDISSIVVDVEATDIAVIASYASFRFQKELPLYCKKKVLMQKHFFRKNFHLLLYLFTLLQKLIL